MCACVCLCVDSKVFATHNKWLGICCQTSPMFKGQIGHRIGTLRINLDRHSPLSAEVRGILRLKSAQAAGEAKVG